MADAARGVLLAVYEGELARQGVVVIHIHGEPILDYGEVVARADAESAAALVIDRAGGGHQQAVHGLILHELVLGEGIGGVAVEGGESEGVAGAHVGADAVVDLRDEVGVTHPDVEGIGVVHHGLQVADGGFAGIHGVIQTEVLVAFLAGTDRELGDQVVEAAGDGGVYSCAWPGLQAAVQQVTLSGEAQGHVEALVGVADGSSQAVHLHGAGVVAAQQVVGGEGTVLHIPHVAVGAGHAAGEVVEGLGEEIPAQGFDVQQAALDEIPRAAGAGVLADRGEGVGLALRVVELVVRALLPSLLGLIVPVAHAPGGSPALVPVFPAVDHQTVGAQVVLVLVEVLHRGGRQGGVGAQQARGASLQCHTGGRHAVHLQREGLEGIDLVLQPQVQLMGVLGTVVPVGGGILEGSLGKEGLPGACRGGQILVVVEEIDAVEFGLVVEAGEVDAPRTVAGYPGSSAAEEAAALEDVVIPAAAEDEVHVVVASEPEVAARPHAHGLGSAEILVIVPVHAVAAGVVAHADDAELHGGGESAVHAFQFGAVLCTASSDHLAEASLLEFVLQLEVQCLLGGGGAETGELLLLAVPGEYLHLADAFGGEVLDGGLGVVAEEATAIHGDAADLLALGEQGAVALHLHAGESPQEVLDGRSRGHLELAGVVLDGVAADAHGGLGLSHHHLEEFLGDGLQDDGAHVHAGLALGAQLQQGGEGADVGDLEQVFALGYLLYGECSLVVGHAEGDEGRVRRQQHHHGCAGKGLAGRIGDRAAYGVGGRLAEGQQGQAEDQWQDGTHGEESLRVSFRKRPCGGRPGACLAFQRTTGACQ